jgi:hypothetical protein
MLTCLQKHEYDNFACEKEVADFYACVNEFQVNKSNNLFRKRVFMY